MKTIELSSKELKKLAKKLQELEYLELCSAGLKNRNGGFATIDYYDADDNYIYVEVQHGIQCGGDDDYTHSENASLIRKTLEWV